MAFFYFNVRRYREIANLRERSLKFRRINHLMTSKRLGKVFLFSGLALIFYQLTQVSSFFENPQASSKELNLLYYSIRPTYILGVMFVLMAIISGSFSLGKACLSNEIFRIISRSLPVGCVVQVIIIQFLYMSEAAAPQGIVISWPNLFWLFVGQLLIIPLVSFILIILVEQPLLKVFHHVILPHISHDYLLMNFYDLKHGFTDRHSSEVKKEAASKSKGLSG